MESGEVNCTEWTQNLIQKNSLGIDETELLGFINELISSMFHHLSLDIEHHIVSVLKHAGTKDKIT